MMVRHAVWRARVLQTDPIGYKDGINWYAYVGNDPVNKSDPKGNRALSVVKGVVRLAQTGGNFRRVGRELIDDAKVDWVALGDDAATSGWDKFKAGVDLIAGTNLYNEDGKSRPRLTAKERRAAQEKAAAERKAKLTGGEPDGEGSPGPNDKQNEAFSSVVKETGLNAKQAEQLHREISKQDLSRKQILERARDMKQ